MRRWSGTMKRQRTNHAGFFSKVSNIRQRLIPGWPIMDITKAKEELVSSRKLTDKQLETALETFEVAT
jgi:hypothetical protein